jgi:RNA polymerase sigma-70 factor (ECF subfamily)
MLEGERFRDLIRRAQAGDEAAANDLVGVYAPAICRAARVLLAGSCLHRAVDSVDICQSVLVTFFVRLTAKKVWVEQPCQLLKLLLTMAEHKVYDQVRRQRARVRDIRRVAADRTYCLEELADRGPGPAEAVADEDLVAAIRGRLSPEVLDAIEQHLAGRPWPEIAAGGEVSAEALRKQCGRALRRVARCLGL